MAYRYRYTGDSPNVFIALKKDGHTWVPDKGDTIDSESPIHHPLLELVKPEAAPVAKKTFEPAKPEVNEKPSAAQESEDN